MSSSSNDLTDEKSCELLGPTALVCALCFYLNSRRNVPFNAQDCPSRPWGIRPPIACLQETPRTTQTPVEDMVRISRVQSQDCINVPKGSSTSPSKSSVRCSFMAPTSCYPAPSRNMLPQMLAFSISFISYWIQPSVYYSRLIIRQNDAHFGLLGVGALYLILHGLTDVLSKKLQYSGFESGVYGNPPAFNFWARQAALYVMSLTTMKLLVIMIIILVPGIFDVGEWLLRWTRGGDGEVILYALHVLPSSSLGYLFITFPNDSVMGIFPIIMNVLQFWLIDSIVKASGNSFVELDDNNPELQVTQDREPLFRVPEDEDEDDYRPRDIENGRARHSSPGYNIRDKRSFNTVTGEYNKHSAITSEQPADHSYPPSLASSTSSTQIAAPRRASSLGKPNRRAAPTPLTIRNSHTPAINSHSPRMSPTRDIVPQVPLMPLAAPIPRTPLLLHPSDNDSAWAETWEDSEEWADRDETSHRIERTNDALGGTSTIRVGS